MNATPENWAVHYLPLLAAGVCACLMIVSRLLTNRAVQHFRRRAEQGAIQRFKESNSPKRVEMLFDAVTDSYLPNAPVGRIPAVYSVAYLVGLVGLVITFFWAFISIGWQAGAIVVGVYFLTGLVRSSLYKPLQRR